MADPFNKAWSDYKKRQTETGQSKFNSSSKTSLSRGGVTRSGGQVAINKSVTITETTTTPVSTQSSSDVTAGVNDPFTVARLGNPVSMGGVQAGQRLGMSLRDDQQYTIYEQVVGGKKNDGGKSYLDSGRINPGRSNINPQEAQRNAGFESRVKNVSEYQKGMELRQERLIEGFGGGANKGFWPNVGAYTLATPALVTVGLGDQIILFSAKRTMVLEGLARPAYRQSTLAEMGSAAKKFPSAAAQTFNPTTPSGLVNDVLLVSPLAFKYAGNVRFVGKSANYIPAESIVEPEVLSGAKTFPSTSKSSPVLRQEFLKSEYQEPIKSKISGSSVGGWSASPKPVSTSGGVQAGTSATPGLYLAPSLSKYFLKLGGSGESISFSILPRFNRPSAQYVRTQGVELIPDDYVISAERAGGGRIGSGGQSQVGNVNRQAAIVELNKYFSPNNPKGIAGTGKAAITPEFYLGKGEKEALVGQGSGLAVNKQGWGWWDKLTGFKYYTKIDGDYVPIRVLEAGKGTKAGLAEVSKTSRITRGTEEYYNRRGRVGVSLKDLSGANSYNYKQSTETFRPTSKSSPSYKNYPSYKSYNPSSKSYSAGYNVYAPASKPSIKIPSYKASSLTGSITKRYNPSRSATIPSYNPTPSRYTPRRPYNPPRNPTSPPFFFKPGGLEIRTKLRNFGVYRPTSYVPSFSALYFKQFGRYKKGRLSSSGLDFRPITGGFDINKLKYSKVYVEATL